MCGKAVWREGRMRWLGSVVKRTVMVNEKRRSEKQKQRRKSTVNYRVKGERREAWMVTGEEGEKEDIIWSATYPCALRQNLVRPRFCLCLCFILCREGKKTDRFSSANNKEHELHEQTASLLKNFFKKKDIESSSQPERRGSALHHVLMCERRVYVQHKWQPVSPSLVLPVL